MRLVRQHHCVAHRATAHRYGYFACLLEVPIMSSMTGVAGGTASGKTSVCKTIIESLKNNVLVRKRPDPPPLPCCINPARNACILQYICDRAGPPTHPGPDSGLLLQKPPP